MHSNLQTAVNVFESSEWVHLQWNIIAGSGCRKLNGNLFSRKSLARASKEACLYNGADSEDPSIHACQCFLTFALGSSNWFLFLFGFLPVLCCDQMDGDSEEDQESPDTGEDEDGGDESDLVI